MTAEYIPQPGTIAHRVLAHLRALPDGTMQSSAVIADALDFGGDIGTYMVPAYEHGLVAREKRDGRWWWGVGHPQLRPLGAPPAVTADEDDVDDAPMVHRVVPASKSSGVSLVDVPAWSPPVKESIMTAFAPTPPQPKKARVAAPAFDPLAIELKKGRALPPNVRSGASPYKTLLERMEPGDSVDLHPVAAKSMVSAAKKLGIKVAVRTISGEVSGVWRL